MASKTVIAFLLILISTAMAGMVEQSSASDVFLESINKQRLALCDEIPGERSVFVHIFNLTNPGDFLNRTKPLPHIGVFDEVGPFNFDETKSRKNCWVALDDLNINFKSVRKVSTRSSSVDFDAPLNTVNIAFSHFGLFVLKAEYMPTVVLNPFIKNGEGYLRHNSTARDLLIDGYNISTMNSFLQARHPFNVTELQNDRFTPFSELSYPNKLTLRSDPETFGQVQTIKRKDLVEEFESSNATDGSVFPGNITAETLLSFYSEDLCSVVPLVFEEAMTYESIPSFKFVLAENALELAGRNCTSSGDYSENVKTCLPNGAVDVKNCQHNLPYIVSLPHFLNADPKYTYNISGMSPNKDLHQSYFIIEPVTGSVLESSLKFQLNVNLMKFEYEDLLWDNVSIQDTIFPLLWTEKKFVLAEEKLVQIQKYLEEMDNY